MVDVVDRVELRDRRAAPSGRASASLPSATCAPISSKLGASLARSSSVVPGRGNSSWSSASVPSSWKIGTRLRSKRPSASAFAARSWLSTARPSHCSRREALDGGDQVGGDALGDHRVLLEEVRVVGGEAVDVHRRRPRHRLDAAGDDEVLVAGQHAHGGEVDGLLARAAEAVEGDAGRVERPAGVERGHAGDVHRVVAAPGAAAHDHVVDLGGVEAVAVAQRVRAPGPGSAAGGRVQRAVLLPLPRGERTASMMNASLGMPFLWVRRTGADSSAVVADRRPPALLGSRIDIRVGLKSAMSLDLPSRRRWYRRHHC